MKVIANSELIEKELDSFLTSPPGHDSILIEGDWGTGKTFFIKQYMRNRRLNYFYVSCLGVNSASEMKKAIIEVTHKKITNFRTFFKWPTIFLKNSPEPTTKIATEIVDLSLSASLKYLEKNYVPKGIMVIDDLEETDNAQHILSSIYQMNAQSNLKIIFIGKQIPNSIERIDKFIGTRIEFKNNYDDIIESFFSEQFGRFLSGSKLNKIMDSFTRVFEKYGDCNLRIARSSIYKISQFYDKNLLHCGLSDVLLEKVIGAAAAVSIYLTKKSILSEDGKSIGENSSDNRLQSTENEWLAEVRSMLDFSFDWNLFEYSLKSLNKLPRQYLEKMTTDAASIDRLKDLFDLYLVTKKSPQFEKFAFDIFQKLKGGTYSDAEELLFAWSTFKWLLEQEILDTSEFTITTQELDDYVKQRISEKCITYTEDSLTRLNHASSFYTYSYKRGVEDFDDIRNKMMGVIKTGLFEDTRPKIDDVNEETVWLLIDFINRTPDLNVFSFYSIDQVSEILNSELDNDVLLELISALYKNALNNIQTKDSLKSIFSKYKLKETGKVGYVKSFLAGAIKKLQERDDESKTDLAAKKFLSELLE